MQKIYPHRTMLRCPSVESITGKKKSSLYEDVANGLLPAPVKIGLRASAWPQHEIDAVLSARIAGKSHDEIRTLVRQLVADRKSASSVAA